MLDEDILLNELKGRAFGPSSGPPAVGLEVEMLPLRGSRAVPLGELLEAIEPFLTLRELQCFCYGPICLTFEPGGQIEIISPPRTGLEAWPYQEYSAVFFGEEYKILRGGSWATRPGVIRTTFRNWDYPIRRPIFSGFRCAPDA